MDLRIHIFCILTLSRLEPNVVIALKSELETFANAYKFVIDTLQVNVKTAAIRLYRLKMISERFIKEHENVIRDKLEDPVSIFKLIKGLSSDFHALEKMTEERTGFRNVRIPFSQIYPQSNHLDKAAFVLTMIQNTYELNLTQLTDGLLNVSFNANNENHIQYSSSLNEDDCFAIGRYLRQEEKYQTAIVWLLEAFRKYKNERRIDDLEADILEELVYAYCMLRDVKEMSLWIQKLLIVAPKYTQNNKFTDFIEECNDILNKENDTSHKPNSIQYVMHNEEILETCTNAAEFLYNKACRCQTKIVNEVDKRLKCKYLSDNHPFLKLAPVKMEELYLEPDVYLFHNIISDREINNIKYILSKLQFMPCGVDTNAATKSDIYKMRLCEAALLDKFIMSEEILKIRRRITDVTGMTTNYSELLHIVKYWVGGYYGTHVDFGLNATFVIGNSSIRGNRIATILIYLSNTVQGGATVFPTLGLYLYPVKGAALFWKNLYPSGEGDPDTIHAACPVIRGSKIILTQWISNIGQELSMPCNLKQERGWRENVKVPIISKTVNAHSYAEIKKDMKTCRRYDFVSLLS